MSAQTTFFAGGAFALGSGVNPGVNVCLEPIKKINTYFGVGGHIDYTWFSASGLPPDVSVNLHSFDIALVPKGYWPVGKEMNVTFEIDPGWYGFLLKVRDGDDYATIFNKRFGLTTAPGFTVGNFSFAFKFKTVFVEGAGSHGVSLVNWIVLCAGIAM
jgi:hypothetical protein